MATPILETARLILHPLALPDATAIQEIFPKWEIVRYMSARIPWPYPVDGALAYIREMALPAVASGIEWHWTIRLKTAPEHLIGAISLADTAGNNRGFWLGLPWQGQGLMSEASSAVTDYWFDVLGRPLLQVPKAVANTPSRRISERTGMRLVKTGEHNFVAGRLTEETWEISRDEWRNRPR